MSYSERDMNALRLLILLCLKLILINTVIASEWVVVVTVSKWYDEIFQNWLIWYRRLDLGMETIVIAEDSITYDKYRNNSDFTLLQFEVNEVRFCHVHIMGEEKN